MKYVIKKLGEDFIHDELEQVRKQFVDALTYTIESANVVFDEKAKDPLDIYIKYDFQQKNGEDVVHGFNLREEIIRSFGLDVEKYHLSEQLLIIAKNLRNLADELDYRYDPDPDKTRAEIEDKNYTEFAENINRSYKEVLKDAIAKDEALAKEKAMEALKQSKEILDVEYQLTEDAPQTVLPDHLGDH
jgi:hypothetical protein